MTEIVVKIPAALRGFAGGMHELGSSPGTVREVFEQLRNRHPEMVQRLLTSEGELRPFVNVFLGRANVRSLQGLATPVPAGSVMSILPAVAGG